MNKIKIVGALIFILSIVLAVLFNYTSKENINHDKLIQTINEQKSFTQEISKNIFYIYKNKNNSTIRLDESVKHYLKHMTNKHQTLKNKELIKLWNTFYLHVQQFRDQIKVNSPYSNILLEKNVNTIYNTNLKLIFEFNKLIKEEKESYIKEHMLFKTTQYILFIILVLLLLFLFTQLKTLITFIQKFIFTSKSIISNSSIKELEPINIQTNSSDVSTASNNFNSLITKIDNSIINSSNSINHSYESLEIVELHVEELLDFVYEMNNTKEDKNLRKKEDAIIQALEELSSTSLKLKQLKNDLVNLTVVKF